MTREDSTSLRERLRLPAGEPVDPTRYDAATAPAGPDGKAAGRAAFDVDEFRKRLLEQP